MKTTEVTAPPLALVLVPARQEEVGAEVVDAVEVGEVAEEVAPVRRRTRTLRNGGRKQIRAAGRIITAEMGGLGRWLGAVPFLVEQAWLNLANEGLGTSWSRPGSIFLGLVIGQDGKSWQIHDIDQFLR